MIVVSLPQERIRAEQRAAFGDDIAIAELTALPLAKTHTFKLGSFALCHKVKTPLETIWEADASPFSTLSDAENAARAWLDIEHKKQKHQGTDGKRKRPTPSGSDSAGERAASSKKNRGLSA